MPSPSHPTLAQYAAALDDQLALLGELRDLSKQQHAAIASNALGDLPATIAARDRVMKELLGVAARLASLRGLLAARDTAVGPDLASVGARRSQADSLIHEILQRDRETLDAARSASAARGEQARALEAGNATLAAYRRTLASPSSTAVVVSQRA